MTKKIVLFLLIIYPQLAIGDINHTINKYFHIGKMKSYDNEFTLYFKTRSKAIIAKGENSNYLNDLDFHLYMHIQLKLHPEYLHNQHQKDLNHDFLKI